MHEPLHPLTRHRLRRASPTRPRGLRSHAQRRLPRPERLQPLGPGRGALLDRRCSGHRRPARPDGEHRSLTFSEFADVNGIDESERLRLGGADGARIRHGAGAARPPVHPARPGTAHRRPQRLDPRSDRPRRFRSRRHRLPGPLRSEREHLPGVHQHRSDRRRQRRLLRWRQLRRQQRRWLRLLLERQGHRRQQRQRLRLVHGRDHEDRGQWRRHGHLCGFDPVRQRPEGRLGHIHELRHRGEHRGQRQWGGLL